MDRRKFLKALGLGGIASAVAPTLLIDALAPAPGPVDRIAAGLGLAPGVWPSTATGLNHWSAWYGLTGRTASSPERVAEACRTVGEQISVRQAE